MYTIRRSTDIHFAHHIRGHQGSCINIHGHTWKFEAVVGSTELSPEGFVVDFRDLQEKVLRPTYALLDHSLALGSASYQETEEALGEIGTAFLASRPEPSAESDSSSLEIHGAFTAHPGGMKVAVFPFNPTSERLAKWFFDFASQQLNDDRVEIQVGRVYESLHPVESVAEWTVSNVREPKAPHTAYLASGAVPGTAS